MNITDESCLALDPLFCLRNDVDRAVILTRPQQLLADKPSIFLRLPPREAILLALMDGDRTIGQVKSLWAELTDRCEVDAGQEVDRAIRHFTTGDLAKVEVLIKVDETNRASIRRYDPSEFAVTPDPIDLTDPRLRRPYMVYYIPTLFCPQCCVYCYAKLSSRPEHNLLSLGRLREIISELQGLGVEYVQMSGGDPFARKDIFEVLGAFMAAGILPDVPTKLGLKREEATRLKDLGIDLVQISLDSTEPETIDTMVGVRGHHKRAFRVLDDLRAVGLKVRVNTVLTPLNVSTVGSLIDFLGNLGHVAQLTLSPYGRTMFRHSDELFLSPADYAQVDEARQLRAQLYPHMNIVITGSAPRIDPPSREERARNFPLRPLCTANRHGFIILPDGRAGVCEQLYDHPSFVIGDLRYQSVMEMWNSPEALTLVRPDQATVSDGPCKSCPSFSECNLAPGRCWREIIKAYGRDKPHYPDPRCPHAPPTFRLN